MNEIPKITLDNNCIINMFDHSSTTATSVPEINELIRLSHSGSINVAITTRVEAELAGDSNDERRISMLKNLKMFPVVGTVARYGVSKWGGGDVWGTKEARRISEELKAILFPGGIDPESATFSNKTNDVDHLLGHLINGRDIFVTDDGGILKKKPQLKASPGINVMSPKEAVAFIEALDERRRVVPLPTPTDTPGYFSKAHKGIVDFNYSNNNGSFTLGDGVYAFETKWSKASDTAIHAYNDAQSIKGIALVKSIDQIGGIKDVGSYDYTSRVRTIRLGQILLLENTNGVHAAIKVLEIEDDSRGANEDRLVFEYIINDFGQISF